MFDHGPTVAEQITALVHELLEDVATPDVVVAAELPAIDPEVGQEEIRGSQIG